MLLIRPKEFELVIDTVGDYASALTAIALASLKTSPTTIHNIERTALLARIEPILATSGLNFLWHDESLTLSRSSSTPISYIDPIVDYDMFKFLLVLAATKQGSRLSLFNEIDDTIQTIVLALRRMGAELEFVGGTNAHVIVHQPVSREIKYHLKRENAKIIPQLVIAAAAQSGSSELMDLFETNRFDYLFSQFLMNFRRENLVKIDPADELERRLAKRAPKTYEYKSRVTIDGGIKDADLEISLHPDTEFAAFLAAAVVIHNKGRLVLRNTSLDDIASSPLGQLRRMGVEVDSHKENEIRHLTISRSEIKSRSVNYEQLHDYPDSVGALALANSVTGGTAVIHASPFNTSREEARRRNICNMIRRLGIKVAEISDGVVLEGKEGLSAYSIEVANDPVCALMAAAASLGTVSKLEVDNLEPARERWGKNFERVLELIAARP